MDWESGLMNIRKTVQIVSWAGTAVLLGFAGASYLINTGSSGDHGASWCVYIFILLEIALLQYVWYCITHCPGGEREGHQECTSRCFLRFFILELLLIIFLLSCLLFTGPKW